MAGLRLVSTESHKLRIVVLEKPYDSWQDEATRQAFVKMIGLKLEGYLAKHVYGALPVDTIDFIGDHVIVCRENGTELVPISAFKTITADCCQAHNLPFQAETVLTSSSATDHLDELHRIMSEAQKGTRRIAYVSSWTIHPEVRKDRFLSEELKQIIPALVAQYHRGKDISEIIACGVPRFRTDEFNHSIGFRPLARQGQSLCAFPQASLLGEPVIMMHLKEFSSQTEEYVERYMDLWKSRLVIPKRAGGAEEEEKIEAKKAGLPKVA